LSDTVKFRHRQDLCKSIRALLSEAADFNIRKLNLKDNLLEADGARSFVDFLKENQTLEVLNVKNCEMEDKSMKMMLDAFKENPSIQLKQLYIGNSTLTKEGIQYLS
tara:strand:+ start:84 stop:404 length:321 start_codon:yes stop_codon:yes gene_type:complete